MTWEPSKVPEPAEGPTNLNLRDNLRAFEGVPDVCKLDGFLVHSCRKYVETARRVKALGRAFFLGM